MEINKRIRTNPPRITKAPRAPRKPSTAFVTWSMKERHKVKAELPHIDVKTIAQVLRERWNLLPQDEKEVYEAKYRVDKANYLNALAEHEADFHKALADAKADAKDNYNKVLAEHADAISGGRAMADKTSNDDNSTDATGKYMFDNSTAMKKRKQANSIARSSTVNYKVPKLPVKLRSRARTGKAKTSDKNLNQDQSKKILIPRKFPLMSAAKSRPPGSTKVINLSVMSARNSMPAPTPSNWRTTTTKKLPVITAKNWRPAITENKKLAVITASNSPKWKPAITENKKLAVITARNSPKWRPAGTENKKLAVITARNFGNWRPAQRERKKLPVVTAQNSTTVDKKEKITKKPQATIKINLTEDMKSVREEDLKKEFECTVCMDIMKPPKEIWQCEAGHLLCGECKNHPTIQNCPSCSMDIVCRNRAMEGLYIKLFSSVNQNKMEGEIMNVYKPNVLKKLSVGGKNEPVNSANTKNLQVSERGNLSDQSQDEKEGDASEELVSL